MPTVTTKPPIIPPRVERLLLVPLFALPILWLAGYFFPPINHDVAAILDVSARWVGGEKLYVEVIDENLPLTFIVHSLPVLTSKVLPGGPTFWFTAWFGPAVQPAHAYNTPSAALSGQRVIMVDDNATNRKVLMGQLLQCGVDPVSAGSAGEAMMLMRQAAQLGWSVQKSKRG